jgi:hypothetical protein
VDSLKELCAGPLPQSRAARIKETAPSAPGPSLGNVAVNRRTATFNHQLITFWIAPLFNFAHELMLIVRRAAKWLLLP